MNRNKYKSTKKVVVSILEHTTQNGLYMLKTELLKILKNALSCIPCLSWLKISVSICVYLWFQTPFLCLPCVPWLKTEGYHEN